VKTNALIDTGHDVNLCRTSFLVALKDVKVIKSTIILSGPADITFETEYRVQVNLDIDDDQYEIELHSVPDSMIMCDVILGRTLFQNCAELHVKSDEVRISRSEVVQQLMAINVNPGELNVGKENYYKTIHDMVYNYKPTTMVKPTAIKTKIILSDDEPVYQRPRRLAPKEKLAVDKQIDEWLVQGVIGPSCSDYASPIVFVH